MKYDHEIIRDLMPLCIDGIASPQSQEAVETHISECPDCKKEWDQMNKGIEQSVQEPLPEPTAKYEETAKRVRNKNRWLLLRAAILMLAGVFSVMILGNWYIGNRYSSKSLARKFVRFSWDPETEWVTEQYHLTEPCSFSELKLNYIGSITTPDRKSREIFITADIPGSDMIGFWSSDVNRENPLTLGMWTDGGGGAGGFSKDEKLIMTAGTMKYQCDEKTMDFFMFYAMDPDVRQIVVQAFGEKQIAVLSDGFGYITREMSLTEHMAEKTTWDTLTEGEALDANGKVLYRIAPVTLNENGDTYVSNEWIKAE